MMEDLNSILKEAVERGASDIMLVAGLPAAMKINGVIEREGRERLMPEDTERLVKEIYHVSKDRDINTLLKNGDDDFSFSLPGLSRFRVNVLKQRDSLAAVIRVVSFDLPNRIDKGIPDNVMEFAKLRKGLVLVTGPAGSGKSTTLACMIDAINNSRSDHIVTIEDPIEFLHRHNLSVVTQREIATDTESYETALRAVLRQAPDVILLGEMRDYETIKVAITAAETGHLVISTLHTVGAVNTIDRIIDIFPPEQQQQIRMQLAMVLQGVVSQQLITTVDGKVKPAFEVMVVNTAIRNMIREAKAHQMENVILSSAAEGMITMDSSLLQLVKSGAVSAMEALDHSSNPEQLQKRLKAEGLIK
ncbi:MAG: PilT/PilU family type 4a pilus ATPase [Syntrophomonadaceae bacterium]|nr:PilT/PilU family type 4a pilus ATPase [Syntrophomonadaceae bacterium]